METGWLEWWAWWKDSWAWSLIEWLFNSNFFAALFGAYFGAKTAQKVADRSKLREELLGEFRRTNAAIELGVGLANGLLNAKEQFIGPKVAHYREQRAAVVAHAQGRGLFAGEMLLGLDFQQLDPGRRRTDALEREVLENLSVSGRPRILVQSIVTACDSLRELLRMRNETIDKIKSGEVAKDDVPALVFGLQGKDGVDVTFGDVMEGLEKECNDAIWLCRLLCKDLREHGLEVRKMFKERFGDELPRVQKADFSEPERKGLFPPDDSYASWKTIVIGMVPKTKGRLLGKEWYVMRRRLRGWRTRVRGLWR